MTAPDLNQVALEAADEYFVQKFAGSQLLTPMRNAFLEIAQEYLHAYLAALPRVGEWSGPDGSRWQHVKRGSTYIRLGVAELQMSCDMLVDGSELFVYVGSDGKVWAREVTEFDDGRFVPAPPATGRDGE